MLEALFLKASQLICSDAKLNKIKKLLDNHPELATFIDKNKINLLCYAIQKNNLSVVSLLLEYNSLIEFDGDLTDINTPLMQSLRCQNTGIIKSLIKKGARVNYAYQGHYPLQLATALNYVDVIIELLQCPDINVNCVSTVLSSPLWIAITDGRLEIIELLLNHPNIDVNCVLDNQNNTVLHKIALYGVSPTIMQLVLQARGVELDVLNSSLKTPLDIAILQRNYTMTKLLVDYGVDPYYGASEEYSPMLMAVDANDSKLLKIFLGKQPVMLALYKLILTKQTEDFIRCFKSYMNRLSQQSIEILCLICINNNQFMMADSIYQQKFSLSNRVNREPCDSNDAIIEPVPLIAKSFSFPEDIPLDKQQGFMRFCTDIINFMANTELCLSLFEDLDADIARKQATLEVDFSKFTPGSGICWNGFKWPSAADEHQKFVSSDGLLRYLIRQQLNKHGIDTQDTLYQFAGFVDSNLANSLVAGGALFKEQFLLGTAMLHGLYSHYLQWYLISKAVDKGIICLPKTMTLYDMLHGTVRITYDEQSLWTELLDYLAIDYKPYDFSSPHELNTMLLTTEKLPYLRGYLLNSWYKNIRKMQHSIKSITGNSISYETIIIGQIIAGNVFDRFKPGITRKEVANYYDNIAKIKGALDESTGIVTKVASERLARWSNHRLAPQSELFFHDASINIDKTMPTESSSSAGIGLSAKLKCRADY